ncbi:hypothetical protein HU200_036542 [Digitaria exilis]|uniref:F-box domain-containing protein n=1 Tax=Digitaria exilis TaxID=1010633 RepID=A0A835EL00_9POAL|nr:hypothetical protein HU200_036542 [Digitaria exilis]
MAAILHNFVDAEQWEAENIVGRLGLITHASFLLAGFQTYGARPPSGHLLLRRAGEAPTGSLCLSRCYTAPQLAHRYGAAAAALVVCAQGSEIALLMFLTAGGDWTSGAYLERLTAATVEPLLSRARLGEAEPWASRICRALADGACWGLLRELCHGNGLALTSLVPLPDDVVVEILRRLPDAEDLARVECAGRDLRRVVAERDGELWKPMYEAMREHHRLWRRSWLPWFLLGLERPAESEPEEVELRSWKEKFVKARPRRLGRIFLPRMFEPLLLRNPWMELPSPSLGWWLQDPPEQDTDSTKGESTGGRRRNVPRTRDSHKNKWRGAGTGAIHSPSSRYRWKHR